ncbi:hypothetical protein B14911_10857 [Bacillus sp. NRRL B-14911]|nr:hypothetical protein B14911_10857 [Bacillus sp. NRRL B-14911]
MIAAASFNGKVIGRKLVENSGDIPLTFQIVGK